MYNLRALTGNSIIPYQKNLVPTPTRVLGYLSYAGSNKAGVSDPLPPTEAATPRKPMRVKLNLRRSPKPNVWTT